MKLFSQRFSYAFKEEWNKFNWSLFVQISAVVSFVVVSLVIWASTVLLLFFLLVLVYPLPLIGYRAREQTKPLDHVPFFSP